MLTPTELKTIKITTIQNGEMIQFITNIELNNNKKEKEENHNKIY